MTLQNQAAFDGDWFDWALSSSEVGDTTGKCIFVPGSDHSRTDFDLTATITKTGKIGETFTSNFTAAEQDGSKKITD